MYCISNFKLDIKLKTTLNMKQNYMHISFEIGGEIIPFSTPAEHVSLLRSIYGN